MLFTIPVALAIAVAGAQTTSQNQIQHVETSLNHLTVLEFGEPVSTIALADTDSFRVEHHDDKVFIEPLREGVATNLFIWTESRQLTYELDPAGQLATMDVLIRTEPAPKSHSVAPASVEPSDAEIRKMASLVLAQAMMGVQDIARDGHRSVPDRVEVDLEQVYRAKDQLYIRYSITNQTKEPFRLTTPDVSAPLPTQLPISSRRRRSMASRQSPATALRSFKLNPYRATLHQVRRPRESSALEAPREIHPSSCNSVSAAITASLLPLRPSSSRGRARSCHARGNSPSAPLDVPR
jgi:hypothetical protein